MKEPAMTTPSLSQSYDAYPRIEAAFQAALDESLQPRSPSLLYTIVGQLGLPPGADVLDLGCGEGWHTIELAERFSFTVQGIDPVPRNIELAATALGEAVTRIPELGPRVRFQVGAAEALPVADAGIDLIWCREVIYVLEDLDAVFAECRRVLRPGGQMLIYCNFVTRQDDLPDWWFTSLGIVPAGAEAGSVEAACLRQGFRIEQSLALGSEFGEHAQETTGEPGRRLLHAARLLRDPERYIARFGRANYDIMLSDCLWHIYRMIGKLSPRVYLLRRA
jgi:SAM-dependent methyltransferase